MNQGFSTAVFKIITAVFAIAVAACVIVNFAVSGSLTWAGYPVLSAAYAWLLIAPVLLLNKHRTAVLLATVTVDTLPFLYLLDALQPARNWFFALGAPAALISIASLWITYFVFKFLKMNIWYKSAITVFLFGVIVSGALRFLVSAYAGGGLGMLFSLDGVINMTATLCVTALLIVRGFNRKAVSVAASGGRGEREN